MTLRWGILGPGAIARSFARDLALINGKNSDRALGELHQIIGVASNDRVRAVEFLKEFDCVDLFDNYGDLLASELIDVVYIANVQSSHYESTIQALKAGKHVLCEKPFALNATQAKEMIDLAATNKLFLMEAMWMRFLPHIKEVLRQVDAGIIGEIISLTADHGQWAYRKKNHRLLDSRLGGGSLLDLGIYPITLAYLLLGKPEKIISTARFTVADSELGSVDSSVSMIFNYSNNSFATLQTSIESVTPTVAVISGTLGRIEIDRSFYAPTSFQRIMNSGEIFRYDNPWHGSDYLGLGEEAEEVRACLAAGLLQSEIQNHRATLEVMEILDQIRDQIWLEPANKI